MMHGTQHRKKEPVGLEFVLRSDAMLEHFVFNKTADIGIPNAPERLSISGGVFARYTTHICILKTCNQSKLYARLNNVL